MTKALRLLVAATIVAALSLGRMVLSEAAFGQAVNVQEGDNENEQDQRGESGSGDAVAGQVTGSVSAGDASVDATNRSEDVDAETGEADATNDAFSFTGLNAFPPEAAEADIVARTALVNVQEGDNSTDATQAAEASSGDGVGGQVLGLVTSAGGSADVVAANTSEDVDVDTGDAAADNDAFTVTGLDTIGGFELADLDLGSADNVQEGDNDLETLQDASASTGDGVGGQVLGVVSAGDASLDATNHSEDVDVTTGDADATNDFLSFVGLESGLAPGVADVTTLNAFNVQEGDNSRDAVQDADATSGDAVAGQVGGVVTSAGGSADLVLANTSLDSDSDTGDADQENFDASFTGLNSVGLIAI